jgi:plastocyanin
MLRSPGLIALAVIVAAALPAAALTPEQQKEICEEAGKRFEELYGKPPAAEQPPVVMMFKHTFCPPQLAVKEGSTVRFLNVDKRTSHSFWFRDAGRPESERYMPGEGANMVMDLAPGDHTYLCGPHWEHEGMVGRMTILP